MTAHTRSQAGTLDDLKDESRLFNEKLKRVLKGKPAKELADLLGIQPQTVYSWKSRGYQPATYQLPVVADFGGCSIAYLCDNRIPVDADPHTTVDLGSIKDDALVAELEKRLTATARGVEDLVDRAEGYPWQTVAAWLLSSFIAPTPESDFVLAGLQLFKDIEPRAARFIKIAQSAAPASGTITDLDGGIPGLIDVSKLLNRYSALRDQHPGILAISYYLNWFDADWYPNAGFSKPPAKPTPDWDDRRAWLMARLVTHDDLKDEAIYEPIRARLREMNYIDAEGKPRDYGYSKIGLGDFDLPEPEWDG